MIQEIQIGIMINIGIGSGVEAGTGIDIEEGILIVKGHESGMVELIEMEEERQMLGQGMREMEAKTGTVIGAGHALLLGVATEALLEVQFTQINGIS